jgi:hypothetical protein
MVLQDNFLFNRSVRENIAMTAPAAPLEAVIQAAKMAGAHDFISEQPEGALTTMTDISKRFLIVHQNFPGQLHRFGHACATRQREATTDTVRYNAPRMDSARRITYRTSRVKA